MKHSPGPWKWDDDKDLDDEQLPVLRDASGNVVCDFGVDVTYYPTAGTSPVEADARLIAAAPELLEFVRTKSVQMCHYAPFPCAECEPCAARALIKRIEGEP